VSNESDKAAQLEKEHGLSTEEMIALLTMPAAAEYAYRVALTYEDVERIYIASLLNVGTFSISTASTNLDRRGSRRNPSSVPTEAS